MEELAFGFIGLKKDYFYSLTYREFINTVNGYRKREDNKSREQWMMTRKVMYAAIAVHAKEGLKETDILVFPWEAEKLQNLTEEQILNDILIQQKSEEFFARFDKNKKNPNT